MFTCPSETLINYNCEDAQLYPLLKLAEATGCLADYKLLKQENV